MLEGPKHLWNLHESTFIKLCCISEGDWLRKPLVLLIFEFLRLYVKTLTAGDKYSLCDIWNLQDLIQMQLSKKVKTFFEIFSRFLKTISRFRHFEKKDGSRSLSISKIWDRHRHFYTKCLNKSASEHLWKVNISERRKHLWNLHYTTFTMFFFLDCDCKWPEKYLY